MSGDHLLRIEALADIPTGRVFNSAVYHDGHIYVLGGCGINGVAMKTAEAIDIETGKQWTRLPDLPTAKAATTTIVVDDKVVTLGGIQDNKVQLSEVEAFDPGAQKWISMTPLPEPLQGLSARLRGDKVLVVGGSGKDQAARDTFMCWDPRRNKWQNFPAMPHPRYSGGTFLVDDVLYVIGGRQGRKPIAHCEAFDMRGFQWRTLPDIPGDQRVFPAFAHAPGTLLHIGGLRENPQDGFSDVTNIFDISTETWREGGRMGKPRGDTAVAIIEGKVVVAGGFGHLAGTERSVEYYDFAVDKWTVTEDMPSIHASAGWVALEDALYLFSGMDKAACVTGAVLIKKKL